MHLGQIVFNICFARRRLSLERAVRCSLFGQRNLDPSETNSLAATTLTVRWVE